MGHRGKSFLHRQRTAWAIFACIVVSYCLVLRPFCHVFRKGIIFVGKWVCRCALHLCDDKEKHNVRKE